MSVCILTRRTMITKVGKPLRKPCLLVLAVFLVLSLLCLIFIPYGKKNLPALAGDTVFLTKVDHSILWSWTMLVNDNPNDMFTDSPHTSDIFVVPTSSVKSYTTTRTYQGADVYNVNASRNSGEILYIYQLESLEYEVTARSSNTSVMTGRLLIYNDYYNLYRYQTIKKCSQKSALHKANFQIGANNQPIKTNIKFNVSMRERGRHKYFFVACATPADVTLSFRAKADVRYYNYTDYTADKYCSLYRQDTVNKQQCRVDILPSDGYTMLAYVNPSALGSSATHLKISVGRSFPSPSFLIMWLMGGTKEVKLEDVHSVENV